MVGQRANASARAKLLVDFERWRVTEQKTARKTSARVTGYADYWDLFLYQARLD